MEPIYLNRLRVRSGLPPAIILPQNFKLDDDTQYDPIITHNKLGCAWSSYYGACLYSHCTTKLKVMRSIFISNQQSIKLIILEAIRIKNNKWIFFLAQTLGSDGSESFL